MNKTRHRIGHLIIITVLTVMLAVTFVGAQETVETVNLLTPNIASVETDTTGFTAATGGNDPVRDTARALDGAASLRISGDGSRDNQGVWLASIFVPDNRGTYTASVYVYGKKGDQFFLNLQEKKNTGTSVVNNHNGPVFTLPGDGWERIHATATMTEGDTLGVVVRHALAEPFEAWLDQFQLESGSEPSPWQAPRVTKNLLTYNQATFAFDTRGFVPAKGSGFAPDIYVDDSTAWEGETSLKIVGAGIGAGEGIYSWPAFVPDNRGTYTASVYMKGEPGDEFYLVLEEKGPAGTGAVRSERGETFALSTNDWERHTITTTMTTGDTLTLTVRHGTFFPYTVWLDGVQVEEAPTATEWVPPAKPVAAQ